MLDSNLFTASQGAATVGKHRNFKLSHYLEFGCLARGRETGIEPATFYCHPPPSAR